MRFHQLSVLSVLGAVPFADFATPLPPPWHDMRVKHTWNTVPPNWEALGHPPDGTTIDLHVALKPHHENVLSNALYEVSDQRSPKHVLSNIPLPTIYGAHLSKEQVAQLVAPPPDTLGLINSWLEYHAVPFSSISTIHRGSWLKLTGIPVSAVGTASPKMAPEESSSSPSSLAPVVHHCHGFVGHFVTAVGGTTGYPEAAAQLSGGGFSNHFPRPPYYKFAVPAFLQQLCGRYYGSYNAQGRGIPDISAQALKYFIISNGEGLLVDGTSCSAPTIAAIISLLNDYRLSKGKTALGFLNPWLYGLGSNGLNDITSGSNPGCGTDGFTAIVG
ncbi:peptidase S8/S53 domain-containing protein [Lactarius indigo]|nr:peptidase S8/S53 domain-containing protein [Lactarius indigo]